MPENIPPPNNIYSIAEQFARKANVSDGCITLAGAVEDALRAQDYDAMAMCLIDMFEELHMRSARGELQIEGLSKNLAFWLAKLQELSARGSSGDAYGVAQAAVDVLECTTLQPEHIVALAAYAGFMAYIEPVIMANESDVDEYVSSLGYLQNVMKRVSMLEQTGDTEELFQHCCNVLDKMMVHLDMFERYELIKKFQHWADGHENALQLLHSYLAARMDGAVQDGDTGRKAILTIEEMQQLQIEEQNKPKKPFIEQSVIMPFFIARAAKQGISSIFVDKVAGIDQAIADAKWSDVQKLLNRYFQSMARLMKKETPLTADGLGSPTIQYWNNTVDKLAVVCPDKAVSLLAGVVQWMEEREGAPDPLCLAACRAIADIYPVQLQAQKRILAEHGFFAVKVALCRVAEREDISQFFPIYDKLEAIWQNFLEDCDPARRYCEVKWMADWLDAQSARPEVLDNIVGYYMSFADGEAIPVYEDETAGDFCLSADGKGVIPTAHEPR